MSNALLVRPAQADHESRHGYLLRLAHANGLAKFNWLSIAIDGVRKHRGPWAVCVCCLTGDESIWEKSWCDTSWPFCQRHLIRLRNTCSACRARITSSRAEFSRCACGVSFRAMPIEPMSEELCQLLSGGEVERHTLLWMGAISKYGFTGKPLKRASTKSIRERAELLEEGARVILNWPAAFEDVLIRYRIESPNRQVQLMHSAWPRITTLMAGLLEPKWRELVRVAVEGQLIQSRHSRTPLVTRSPVVQTAQVTLKQLANEAGVRFERLRNVLDDQPGAIAPRRTAAGRARRCPSPQELQQATSKLNDKLALKPAAKLLALSVPRLAEVCKAGHLTISGSSVSLAAASAFLMRQRQQVIPSIATGGMTYPTFLRLHVPLTCTAVFLKLLFEGEIAIHAPTQASPPYEWKLTDETAKKVVGMLKTLKWADFTIGEAAAQLGVKEQVAYQLAAAGHLRTHVSPRSGTRGRRVSPQELEDFRVRLTPLSEVARQAGLSVKAVRHWLPSSGLEVICEPGKNGLRQYFVSTTSARRFLDAGGRIQS